MQVHGRRQGTPVLMLAGDLISLKRMQNHFSCEWLLQLSSRERYTFTFLLILSTPAPTDDLGCLIGPSYADLNLTPSVMLSAALFCTSPLLFVLKLCVLKAPQSGGISPFRILLAPRELHD